MENTAKNPNVQVCCYQDVSKAEDRIKELEEISKDLDTSQKALSNYLDTKKRFFPRFFFISDDELLSILGSSDPEAIQPHMQKLYDNCKTLVFRGRQVVGMVSDEGEKYEFHSAVKPEGAVENWMNKVDEEMVRTLHQIMKEAVFYYAKQERLEWCRAQLGMPLQALRFGGLGT